MTSLRILEDSVTLTFKTLSSLYSHHPFENGHRLHVCIMDNKVDWLYRGVVADLTVSLGQLAH